MFTSVKIERYRDYEELMRIVSRTEACPATDKDLVRPLHWDMLIGTHIPEQYQYQIGALVTLLLRDPTVKDIEVWLTDVGIWIADALVDAGRGQRLRRGEGKTPVEAVINLALDIQRS